MLGMHTSVWLPAWTAASWVYFPGVSTCPRHPCHWDGHQGTHIRMLALKTLIQPPYGVVCAMLSCLQALCLPPPLLFILYFPPSFRGCANEYFMARNQREFPGCALPPAAGTSPDVGGLGRMCLLRNHLRKKGSGQGRKQWLWCRHCRHCPSNLQTAVTACPYTGGLHSSRVSLPTCAWPRLPRHN